MKLLTSRSPWQLKCNQIAMYALTAAFFVVMFSVSLTTICYLSATLFVLLSGNWRERFQFIRDSDTFASVSYWVIFSLFIIGIFYSIAPQKEIIHELRSQSWLLITPFLIMGLTEECWRQRIVNAFLSIMIITLIVSFLKVFIDIHPIQWIHFVRDPNHQGLYWDHITQSFAMNIAAFICAYRYFFEKKSRLFYAAVFILMAIDIIFISKGRTGYGLFFLLLAYLSMVRFGWKGSIVAASISILLIVTAFFISPNFNTRIKAIYEHTAHYEQMHQLHEATSVGTRIEMLNIAKMLIIKRPWFGYGTGGIETAIKEFVPPQDRTLEIPNISSVESIYLNFWLEFGLFGLIVFLAMTAVQIKASFHLPQPYRYLMHVVLISTLFGGLFCSFFNNITIKHVYALFVVLCLSALNSTSSEQKTLTKETP